MQYPSVQHLKKTLFTPVDGIFISHFFPCTTFHLSVPIKTHSCTLYFLSHFPPLLLYHPGCRLRCVCVSVNMCIWWSECSHVVFHSIRCWYLSAVFRLAICANTLFLSTSRLLPHPPWTLTNMHIELMGQQMTPFLLASILDYSSAFNFYFNQQNVV